MRTKSYFRRRTSTCLNDFGQYYILTNYTVLQSRATLVTEILSYMVYRLIVKKQHEPNNTSVNFGINCSIMT